MQEIKQSARSSLQLQSLAPRGREERETGIAGSEAFTVQLRSSEAKVRAQRRPVGRQGAE